MENIKKVTDIEVEGKTLEEAVKKAAVLLGVSREQINVKILSEEQKGLFGMQGAKPAKIRASIVRAEQNKNKS